MYTSYQLILGILWLLVNISCKKLKRKGSVYMNAAVITGFDDRYCACCGGLMINFENDGEPYSSQFYLVDNNFADLGISSSTMFPLYLNIDWEMVPTNCGTPHVHISRFENVSKHQTGL